MELRDEAAADRPEGCAEDQNGGRARRIEKRIRKKIKDHEAYGFSRREVLLLTVFFDLAQEYWGSEDFYTLCVCLPKVFFGLECNLYLLEDEETLSLARCSLGTSEKLKSWGGAVPVEPAISGDRYVVPLRGNREISELLPFDPPQGVIGCIEIYPGKDLDERRKLFFEKFANRVGYQLHIRIIRDNNIEHINFIRNLVQDIGHNVIVPNMYFKLYFNRLKGRIEGLKALAEDMHRDESLVDAPPPYARRRATVEYLYETMASQFQEIFSHYEQTSLFLETLLRRRHFEEGRYVLEKRVCNLRKQVVEPQVQRFRPRLEEIGVQVDPASIGILDTRIYLMADVGLISQVYANFFSNAVKYTEPGLLEDGRQGKFVTYGCEVLKGHFKGGLDGVRLSVFSTGPHLKGEDRANLFRPGFRASNVRNQHGTGHGLFFVRQVVELHGGEVGYEPRPGGNEFYIILPIKAGPEQDRGPEERRA
ncbi:MAG: HAMP domain-containing sensor histidine kinase [Desulfovibrionaceae bacterium]|nr:HAMP domain-containing sensor histidine kinase [Desulfovibrionaceae bacterium]